MTKLKILTLENADGGAMELPQQFAEEIRPDLIARAVLAIQAAARQPYGGYGDAGMRHSTRVSRRRRDYRGSYGKGISRVPRKVHTRRGMQFSWVGALAAGTVGGRRAHPPKPFSVWFQKVNTTENRKAIRSAMSATIDPKLVEARGHKLPKNFPFLVSDDFEAIRKTSDLEAALVKLGFSPELDRAGVIRIRAGRGKSRGRKHKSPTSILFVVSKDATPLSKAAANLPGIDVVAIHRVNAELLAPGTHVGRLTLYTKDAIERLAKEGLFLKSRSAAEPKSKRTEKKTTEKPASAPAKPAVKKTTSRSSTDEKKRATTKKN